MRFINSYRKRVLVFLAVCFTVMSLTYLRTLSMLPGEITLIQGEEYIYDFRSPFLVSIRADRDGILKLNNDDIKSNGSYLSLSSPISFKTQEKGNVNLTLKVLGLIPLRTMHVSIIPNKKVIVCGNTAGVKLKLDGILVIGASDVESLSGSRTIPARESGINPGDFLVEVNQVKLNSINDLIKEVDNSQGKNIKIKYRRGNNYIGTEVKPVMAADDKKYHIGLWVRESTAGIGTLTFYDPETKSFGALGHGVTDIDTGTLMAVESGEILESNILAIKKGKQGTPGELRGVFVEDKYKLGVIKFNSEHGLYGILNNEALDRLPNKQYAIATRSQIKEGAATILANVDGKSVEEYSIEIQKVSRKNINGSKGMIIKVTDPKLLDSTGGIVQGMSGSPIIQNNKIVGAVTHVFVNDPSRGYGIFIECMIKNTIGNSLMAMENIG